MIIPMSAIFASVIALLALFLAYRVSTFRLKYKQGMGHNEDRDFESAMRAHGNLMEYAPLALILMAIGELNGVSAGHVYWVGMTFVVGRLLHAWGMAKGHGGPHRARLVGILLTWLAILAMALLLIWNVYQMNF